MSTGGIEGIASGSRPGRRETPEWQRSAIDRERPPLWLEQRAGLELARLVSSPVYYGVGVPRGDGSPVVLVPGFLGSDGYLRIMRGWLRRIGYNPYPSGIEFCAGSPVGLVGRVLVAADGAAQDTERPVTLIGHSLGGVLGRIVAWLRPDIVTHAVALGSPLSADPRGATHPLVARMAEVLVRGGSPGGTETAQRALVRELLGAPIPAGVRLTSFYTRQDAVVHWRACVDPHPHAVSYEIRGTHCGLAWNAQVYRRLGRLLVGGTLAA